MRYLKRTIKYFNIFQNVCINIYRLRGRETKRKRSKLNATVDILELDLNEESSAQPTAIICTKVVNE